MPSHVFCLSVLKGLPLSGYKTLQALYLNISPVVKPTAVTLFNVGIELSQPFIALVKPPAKSCGQKVLAAKQISLTNKLWFELKNVFSHPTKLKPRLVKNPPPYNSFNKLNWQVPLGVGRAVAIDVTVDVTINVVVVFTVDGLKHVFSVEGSVAVRVSVTVGAGRHPVIALATLSIAAAQACGSMTDKTCWFATSKVNHVSVAEVWHVKPACPLLITISIKSNLEILNTDFKQNVFILGNLRYDNTL